LDGGKHYQGQTDGSKLSENPENHSETSRGFSEAEKNREPFAHSNVLASCLGMLDMASSTRYEHDSNHDA
jgi:hypothetical protein